jgi:hypothetical protein
MSGVKTRYINGLRRSVIKLELNLKHVVRQVRTFFVLEGVVGLDFEVVVPDVIVHADFDYAIADGGTGNSADGVFMQMTYEW